MTELMFSDNMAIVADTEKNLHQNLEILTEQLSNI